MSLITDALITARRESAAATERPTIDDTARSAELSTRARRVVRLASGVVLVSLVVVAGLNWRSALIHAREAAAAPVLTEPTIVLQSKDEPTSELPVQAAAEEHSSPVIT